MRKFATMAVAALVAMGVPAGMSQARTEDEAIKKVMKAAMKKGGLCGTVAKGQATDEQKAKLLDLFKELSSAKPAKGDEGSWKTKTEACVNAAQAVVDGKPGAIEQLKKAVNCKACHDAHKGE